MTVTACLAVSVPEQAGQAGTRNQTLRGFNEARDDVHCSTGIVQTGNLLLKMSQQRAWALLYFRHAPSITVNNIIPTTLLIELCFYVPPTNDNSTLTHWLIVDWVAVLHHIRHKIAHPGDVSASQSLGLVWKKLNLKQRKQAFTNQKNVWRHKKN